MQVCAATSKHISASCKCVQTHSGERKRLEEPFKCCRSEWNNKCCSVRHGEQGKFLRVVSFSSDAVQSVLHSESSLSCRKTITGARKATGLAQNYAPVRKICHRVTAHVSLNIRSFICRHYPDNRCSKATKKWTSCSPSLVSVSFILGYVRGHAVLTAVPWGQVLWQRGC